MSLSFATGTVSETTLERRATAPVDPKFPLQIITKPQEAKNIHAKIKLAHLYRLLDADKLDDLKTISIAYSHEHVAESSEVFPDGGLAGAVLYTNEHYAPFSKDDGVSHTILLKKGPLRGFRLPFFTVREGMVVTLLVYSTITQVCYALTYRITEVGRAIYDMAIGKRQNQKTRAIPVGFYNAELIAAAAENGKSLTTIDATGTADDITKEYYRGFVQSNIVRFFDDLRQPPTIRHFYAGYPECLVAGEATSVNFVRDPRMFMQTVYDGVHDKVQDVSDGFENTQGLPALVGSLACSKSDGLAHYTLTVYPTKNKDSRDQFVVSVPDDGTSYFHQVEPIFNEVRKDVLEGSPVEVSVLLFY